MSGERILVREAHAKVNACLRVLGRREDGYHELESLVLPLDLADTVTAQVAESLKVDVRGDPDLSNALAAEGMNLALMAALSLAETCDAGSFGALVGIAKRIPVAAGLGGGSADAAATLHLLNELWGCRLHLEDLLGIGERIGSDVPALLVGGPVVMRGRGEHVESIAVAETFWAVRAFDFPTRSPDAYRWWDEDGAETGPDLGAIYAATESGSLDMLGAALFNDLEGPVSKRHPGIAEIRHGFVDAGALGTVMTGSGPTVVALARDLTHAKELSAAVPGAFVASGLARRG